MKRFLLPALILTASWVVFVGLHLFFLQTFLYWAVLWLDILMHLWGGFLVVVTVYYLNQAKLFPQFSKLWVSRPLVLLTLLMIGWEIFKYSIVTELPANYVLDTLIDLICGAVGGLLAYFGFVSRTIKDIL